MAGERGFDRWGRSTEPPFLGSAVAESGPTQCVIGVVAYGGDEHAVKLTRAGSIVRALCGTQVYVIGNGEASLPWEPSEASCAACVTAWRKAAEERSRAYRPPDLAARLLRTLAGQADGLKTVAPSRVEGAGGGATHDLPDESTTSRQDGMTMGGRTWL